MAHPHSCCSFCCSSRRFFSYSWHQSTSQRLAEEDDASITTSCRSRIRLPGSCPSSGTSTCDLASLRDLAAKHGRDGLLLLRLGAVPTLVVSSPRAAVAVLRTHDHVLSSRPWSPVADILFYSARSVAFSP